MNSSSFCPAGSYRRSFLREYAEFLGLDGDTYTAEYDLRLASLKPEPPSPAPHPGGGLMRWLGESPTRTVAVAAAVALVGIAVWQLEGSGGTGLVQATRPARQTRARADAHPPARGDRPTLAPAAAAVAHAHRHARQLLAVGACRLECRAHRIRTDAAT